MYIFKTTIYTLFALYIYIKNHSLKQQDWSKTGSVGDMKLIDRLWQEKFKLLMILQLKFTNRYTIFGSVIQFLIPLVIITTIYVKIYSFLLVGELFNICYEQNRKIVFLIIQKNNIRNKRKLRRMNKILVTKSAVFCLRQKIINYSSLYNKDILFQLASLLLVLYNIRVQRHI